MAKVSYFYVFLADVTELDKNLLHAFEEFGKTYASETKVERYYPGNPEFPWGRRGFDIKRISGFAISDVEYSMAESFSPNPYVSVERGYLEGRTFDELFNLIRDWHDAVLAEEILKLGRDKILEQSGRLFGKVWEGVREVVRVVSSVR